MEAPVGVAPRDVVTEVTEVHLWRKKVASNMNRFEICNDLCLGVKNIFPGKCIATEFENFGTFLIIYNIFYL